MFEIEIELKTVWIPMQYVKKKRAEKTGLFYLFMRSIITVPTLFLVGLVVSELAWSVLVYRPVDTEVEHVEASNMDMLSQKNR